MLIPFLMLASCMTLSEQGFRDQGVKESFTVQRNYQDAYRGLSAEMKRCYQVGMITASTVVQSELFTDIRKGTITTALSGGFGNKTMLVVDIVSLDDGSSRIDVISNPSKASSFQNVNGFFSGNPMCQR